MSLSYDTLQPALHNILMDTKDVWARPVTTFACVDALGSNGKTKFPVCVDCSVLPSGRCMTRGLVSGLTFLSGAPGIPKLHIATAYEIAWLTSILILDVLNRVSCFGDYMLSKEESSVSGSVQAVMSLVQLLRIIVL